MHLNTALGIGIDSYAFILISFLKHLQDFYNSTEKKKIVQGVLTLVVPARSCKSAPLP